MNRLTSAFKRFAVPIVVVLVVAAAAVVYLLIPHPAGARFQIPDTGNPQEVICGFDLKQDQNHCKSDPVIPVMPVTPLIPDTGGSVICGYDLRQDQNHCISDPILPTMPVSPQIPPTGGQPVICGYDLRQDQNHCISDPILPVIPDTGSKTSPYVSVPIELERGYNLKENQSFFK